MEDLLRKLPLGLLIDMSIPLKNNWRRNVQKEVNELLRIIDEIIKEKSIKDEELLKEIRV